MGARWWLVLAGIGCDDIDPVVVPEALPDEVAAPAPAGPAAMGNQTALPAAAPDCTLAEDGEWPAAWLACGSDEDCAEVSRNGCPCSAGGWLVPIAQEYTACVARPPAGHVCPQVYLCDDLVPRCDAGVCVRR